MRRSVTSILGLLGCLALTAVGILRADSTNNPSPSTQPDTAMSPEDFFRNRGLGRMGFWLIIPDEADIHDRTRLLRAAKARLGIDDSAQRDSDFTIKQDADELNDMESQYQQLNDILTQSIASGNKINKNDIIRYNNWVNTNNELQGRRDSLGIAIDQKIREMQSMQQQHQGGSQTRSNYLNLAMDLDAKAEQIATAYAALARDAALSAVIAEYNQTNLPHARLGPSGLFQEDLDFIRACARDVQSGVAGVTIGVGGGPCVQAVINGKVTDTMIWDSGATMVLLSYATAQAAGVKWSDSDQTANLTMAEGKTVKAHDVLLTSIQLAGFTVKNVECAILPPEYGVTDDLLGDTFQRHFLCRLDQSGGKLQLTPVDPDVTQGPMVEAPAFQKPTATAGPSSAPPTQANLLDTMQGDTSRRDDGAIVLQGNERITTAETYAPPVRFTIVAQTDSTNLRIGYAADQIIFNWEENQDQLRIDGGPADGKHKDGAGRIPTDQWVTVQLTVMPKSMAIAVDGKRRYGVRADFSQINQPLSIFTASGAVIKVKSVTATVPTTRKKPSAGAQPSAGG
jgi:clan AA aspartic protease (TIGR02281 family)